MYPRYTLPLSRARPQLSEMAQLEGPKWSDFEGRSACVTVCSLCQSLEDPPSFSGIFPGICESLCTFSVLCPVACVVIVIPRMSSCASELFCAIIHVLSAHAYAVALIGARYEHACCCRFLFVRQGPLVSARLLAWALGGGSGRCTAPTSGFRQLIEGVSRVCTVGWTQNEQKRVYCTCDSAYVSATMHACMQRWMHACPLPCMHTYGSCRKQGSLLLESL